MQSQNLEESTPPMRDRCTTSSFSDDAADNGVQYIETRKGHKVPEKMPKKFQLILVPPNADPTMKALFVVLNQINTLI